MNGIEGWGLVGGGGSILVNKRVVILYFIRFKIINVYSYENYGLVFLFFFRIWPFSIVLRKIGQPLKLLVQVETSKRLKLLVQPSKRLTELN